MKSNGVGDGELKLREARLEFRGSKKEDSECEVEVESCCMVGESKMATCRGAGKVYEAAIIETVLCVLCGRGVLDGRKSGSEGMWGI